MRYSIMLLAEVETREKSDRSMLTPVTNMNNASMIEFVSLKSFRNFSLSKRLKGKLDEA